MHTVGITGGTGFIGHHLTSLLKNHGYRVIIFTRDMHKVSRLENVRYSFWSPSEHKFDLTYFKDLSAVIHLAGAGVADKRWTKKRKELIVSSRVGGTRFLIERLKEHAPQCKTFIAASAIGYYGTDGAGKTSFKEADPPANDFLAETCRKWEEESLKAAEYWRTIILRFGVVLGRDDGAFPKLAGPQRFGVVPILGSGRQIMSWIHVDDLCRMICWALQHQNVKGIFNAAAPYPVSFKRLMDTIAHVKGGVKITVPVPGVLLRIGLGEAASEILKSSTVSSEKIRQEGFSFNYPDIKSAVKEILK